MSPSVGRLRRAALALTATALVAPLLGTLPADAAGRSPLERARAAAAARVPGGVPANPFTTLRLAVDADSQAAHAAAAARDRGDEATARALDLVASRPQAAWYGDWTPTATVAADVSRRVTASAAAGRTETLVLYAIPGRHCEDWAAGGLSVAEYGRWVREVARGLGGRRAVVVLEPDALALMDCLPAARRTERLALVRDAVEVLATAGALVYVDAGHADWVPADEMASRLRGAGVARARGVSLNVSGFGTTAAQTAYAAALAARLPGLKAVVDTSRNGAGPAPDKAWCNPPGRALGTSPRAASDRVVEALLWIKRPGESDGDCGRGEPPAGHFWVAYAVGLATRSA